MQTQYEHLPLPGAGGVAAPPLADSMRAMFHSALLPGKHA
jgi:hypothetical protein